MRLRSGSPADDDTRLDDLFGPAPAPSPRRPTGPPEFRVVTVRWAVLAVLAAAAGTLVINAFAALSLKFTLPYPFLFAGLLSLFVARRLTLATHPSANTPVRGEPDPLAPPPDGLTHAITRWETRLSWTWDADDVDRYSRTTRAAIAALADERLRQRHGVTLASAPEKCRELLGEAGWTFLTQPLRRIPDARELTTLLTRVERL